MDSPIPTELARTVTALYKTDGVAWLARLPDIIAGYERRWSLTTLPPFAPLTYNYVAPALRADGTDAVLKVGFPNTELLNEIETLRRYDGVGFVRLLEADADGGALLLERLRPGTMLAQLEDDERATSVAAGVMRRLRLNAPEKHDFPTVARWAEGFSRLRRHFKGATGPFPARLVETAETLFAELLASSDAPVLLHGDLHHYNILAAARDGWLAIDPKGVIGEPAYEVGALLRNPLPQLLRAPQPSRTLARRVDQLSAELNFDRARVVGWATAQAVLSAWWSFEDEGGGHEPALACAQLLANTATLRAPTRRL
ncbi:MAG: aminoglycoside phosphotransferase family protein [Pyrinomonadaceae bacterium]